MSTPPVVRLDVWGVSGMQIPRSFLRMGSQRRAVRSLPGLQFAKLMGTGSGETFTMRDADPTHWALLTTWVDEDHARAFEESFGAVSTAPRPHSAKPSPKAASVVSSSAATTP